MYGGRGWFEFDVAVPVGGETLDACVEQGLEFASLTSAEDGRYSVRQLRKGWMYVSLLCFRTLPSRGWVVSWAEKRRT